MYSELYKYGDDVNADGMSVSIFVSGCDFACKNCFNKQAQDKTYGNEFNEQIKNYYANTQEENFYMIGTSPKLSVNINSITVNNPDDIVESQGTINPTSTIKVTTTGIQTDNIRLIVKQNQYGRTNVMTPEELGDAEVTSNTLTIKTTNIPTGGT